MAILNKQAELLVEGQDKSVNSFSEFASEFPEEASPTSCCARASGQPGNAWECIAVAKVAVDGTNNSVHCVGVGITVQ